MDPKQQQQPDQEDDGPEDDPPRGDNSFWGPAVKPLPKNERRRVSRFPPRTSPRKGAKATPKTADNIGSRVLREIIIDGQNVAYG